MMKVVVYYKSAVGCGVITERYAHVTHIHADCSRLSLSFDDGTATMLHQSAIQAYEVDYERL